MGVSVIAGEARGQQEGLQYDRQSSGAVDNRVVQVENIGKMWDRS